MTLRGCGCKKKKKRENWTIKRSFSFHLSSLSSFTRLFLPIFQNESF